ncbi:MAG: hypothetical protein R3E89_07440 [Thiolinea sp.]
MAFVKKGTPDDIVAKLTDAYEQALNPMIQKAVEERGFTIVAVHGDEAADFLNRWQSVTSWLGCMSAGISAEITGRFWYSQAGINPPDRWNHPGCMLGRDLMSHSPLP